MSLLVKLAVFVLCVYAAILLAAYLGQRRLMYFPDRAYTRPAEVGLMDVEERVLKTPDGARVITWYGKAQPGKPTLLYFHGNAGSLAVRAERIRRFMNEGWGVCMMSYRGYSGSKGSPTETANVADARLAYGALVQDGVDPASIILYGESLGSGVAVRLATERPTGGIILDAPYTSILEVAEQAYPFLPVRHFLKDRYEIEELHRPGADAVADPARRARSRDPGDHGTRVAAAGERAQAAGDLPLCGPQQHLRRRQPRTRRGEGLDRRVEAPEAQLSAQRNGPAPVRARPEKF